MVFNTARISDFDLAGITNEVNRWQTNGCQAHYDVSKREYGLVELHLENVFRDDGSMFAFSISKGSEKGFLRTKNMWLGISYIYGGPLPDTEEKGAIAASSLASLLTQLIADAKQDFPNKSHRIEAVANFLR